MKKDGSNKSDHPYAFGGISDQATIDDDLGFGPYVEAVKEFITADSTDPPLSISIEGEWGSGKSSFMNQLKESLDKEGKKTVQFNPWKYEENEAVWSSFALKFIDDLKSELGIIERSQKKYHLIYRRYIDNSDRWAQAKLLFTFVAFAVPAIAILLVWLNFGAGLITDNLDVPQQSRAIWYVVIASGGSLATILAYTRIWGRLRSDFSGSLESNLVEYAKDPDYGQKTGFIEAFHRDFDDILDVYVGENERIYVFIDDLDRCSVPEAANLMQSINLLLSDDSRVVFILGLDRGRVAAGVAAKHSDLLEFLGDEQTTYPNNIQFGYQYLEKFIQIPFLVPEPKGSDIQSLIKGSNGNYSDPEESIDEYWHEITERHGEKLDDIVDMAAPALGNNPRQVKRFINLLQLRTVLARIEDVLSLETTDNPDVVTLPQLAKFVLISIQWPQLISKMSNDETTLNRIMQVADGEEDIDILDLEPWVKDAKLIDMLGYGESQEFDLRGKNIRNLVKISPRVDKPTKSGPQGDKLERNVSICTFNPPIPSSALDRLLQADSRITTGDMRIRSIEVYSPDADSVSIQSGALHCMIWVAEPELQHNTEFKRMYEMAAAGTKLYFYGNKPPAFPVDETFYGAEFVSSDDELLDKIVSDIKRVDPKSEHGDEIWESWRKNATRARDDYLHGG